MLNSGKKLFIIALSLFLFGSVKTYSQALAPNQQFRIIGYLRESDIIAGKAQNFDFSKITHLNIAFINPAADGSYPTIPWLSNVVTAAHSKNVKVLASLAGGAPPAYYLSLITDSNRANFINNTVKMVMDNQLDGVDVDLEGARIDSNYEKFVVQLSTAMKQQHKLITAAVATSYRSSYSDKALAEFDFINIMSYDKTGPWRPADAGQHSPYDMAVADLTYWATRGIPKDKLSLGVPFYGYSFGTGAVSALTYKQIINAYPGGETVDTETATDGGTLYYNGMGTIAAKTAFALQNAGGIMIWHLLQDSDDEKSLLGIIDATVKAVNKQ